MVDAAKKYDVVSQSNLSGQLYSMRTIRARYGTDWCKAYREAVRL